MYTRRTAVVIRSTYGTSAVEWFLIFAIATILITRGYLAAMGWPQIGGGNLHIAHALWGGALMMLALLIGWLFLGSSARGLAILLGGIGFGLLLDEVGKFVTKDNDYFYGPSAEIMYILVVVVLVLGRLIRDIKKPTPSEAVANAAALAANGLAHGLTPRSRAQAADFLRRADEAGVDPAITAHIRGLLDASADTPDRLMALRRRATALIPNVFRSPKLLTFFGWLLVTGAAITVVTGILSRVLGSAAFDDSEIYVELSRDSTASWILFVSGAVTLVLALPAMLARRRTDKLWPLKMLRLAALIYMLLTALVDFALDGFGGLVGIGLGLIALAVINYHLGVRETARTIAAVESATRPNTAAHDELRL